MNLLGPRGPGPLPPSGRRGPVVAIAVTVASLAVATLAIAVLVHGVRVANAAPVYLLPVVLGGMFFGTWSAVGTAIASFLLYDFFFVTPYYTLTIAEPDEWLALLTFLVVAVAIGRLAGLQRSREQEAQERAHEAQALFAISRALAETRTVGEAAPLVMERLARAASMDRIWFGLGPSPAEERIVADTSPGEPLPVPAWHVILQRAPGDEPARWVRTHVGRAAEPRPGGRGAGLAISVHRVRVEVPGELLGSVWALRPAALGDPGRPETRILSAAADQLGQAVVRDRVATEATTAEIAKRSEALKTALLDSVSHDLRTPLATIRAAAGSMLDQAVTWSPAEQREAFASIDLEAERMSRLVRNLLDLSRIEGGALHPDLGPQDLDDILQRALSRLRPPADRRVLVELPDDLPPLLVDDILLDQILTNLVENAVRYGGATIRIRAVDRPADRTVDVVVEDDGQGVDDADLSRIFEKFYRARRAGRPSSRGMGIGLTVVAGLTREMGGTVSAGRSALGGLSVTVTLPTASLPAKFADAAAGGET